MAGGAQISEPGAWGSLLFTKIGGPTGLTTPQVVAETLPGVLATLQWSGHLADISALDSRIVNGNERQKLSTVVPSTSQNR